MTRKEIAQQKAARDAIKNAGKPCPECGAIQPAHAQTCSKYVKAEKADANGDLGDARVQAAILSPEPFPVTFGGVASALHPLPANDRCSIAFDFWPDVQTAAAELGPLMVPEKATDSDRIVLMIGRCARAIVRTAPLKARFVRFLARAEHAAKDAPDSAVLDARAQVIDLSMDPEELYTALSRFYITEVAGPKVMTQPK